MGPFDGNKPELSNLTLSMTIVDPGDIVFLTSDGVSDNFDPVVGKFADPIEADDLASPPPVQSPPPKQNAAKTNFPIAPRRQNKSESSIASHDTKRSTAQQTTFAKPTSAPVRREKKALRETVNSGIRPKFLRSHTVIEPRMRLKKSGKLSISPNGLPLVTAVQRHALTMLRMEDLLSFGINGTLQQHMSARKLCTLLIDFVKMLTSAKRNMLEQREIFYKFVTAVAPPDPVTGKSSGVVKKEIELNRMQQRVARKRVVDSQTFASLPGKLDHATIVAAKVPVPVHYYRSL